MWRLALVLFAVPHLFSQSLPWPMLGHDPQHSGNSPFVGPQALGNPRIISRLTGAIIIGPGDILYLTTQDSDNKSRLYALNPDGTLRSGWPFVGPSGFMPYIWGSPALNPDGSVIYAAFDKDLYAINADGTQRWTTPFHTGGGIYSSPVVDSLGTIYITSLDGYLYAVNSDGTQKWRAFGFSGYISPALGADGTVFEPNGATPDVDFTAFNRDGTIKWTANYGGTLMNPSHFNIPVVSPDGTIYIVRRSHNNDATYLLGLNPANGTIRYQRSIFSGADRIGITPNGTVFFPTAEMRNNYVYYLGHFVGLSPGLSTVRFDVAVDPAQASPPIVGADGTIYVAVGTRLRALAENGTSKSDFVTPNETLGFGAIASDGTLYMYANCCGNGTGSRIFAFKAVNPPALSVTPQSLIFNYQSGTAGPIPPQTTHVSSTISLSFTAAASTIPAGGNWLSVQPTGGTTPQDLTVSVAPGLAPGTYTGQITITAAASNSPQTVSVQLTVAPPPAGTITVTSVPSGAGFALAGPGLVYYSGATPFTIPAAPIGSYTITWHSILGGYDTPPPETKTLTGGLTLPFSAVYRQRPQVLIVPGFLGTKLSLPDQDLWLSNHALNVGVSNSRIFLDLQYDTAGVPKIPLSTNSGLFNLYSNPSDPKYALSCDTILASIFGTARCQKTFFVYNNLIDALEEAGYSSQTFSYDWRADIRTLSQDLFIRVKEMTASGRPVALVAHSMGGLIVGEMLRAHPVDLVLLCYKINNLM